MERPFQFPSGNLVLDGRISLPKDPRGAAVVCHPHPQYGGSMEVPVVIAVTAALARAGFAALRFDFRGVGRSEGSYGDLVGEIEDAHAAVAALARESSSPSVVLAGYSFGAIVALRAGAADAAVGRIAAIAPPASMFSLDFLADTAKPLLFLAGDRDEFTPYAALEKAIAPLHAPKRSVPLAGADHFLYGFEDEIATHVTAFAIEGGSS